MENEPAFPVNDAPENYRGISMRDYFAVHANEDDLLSMGRVILDQIATTGKSMVLPTGWRTKARYMHADAMLAARGETAESAVMAERERCARICESANNHDNPMTAQDCADAIRSGRQP